MKVAEFYCKFGKKAAAEGISILDILKTASSLLNKEAQEALNSSLFGGEHTFYDVIIPKEDINIGDLEQIYPGIYAEDADCQYHDKTYYYFKEEDGNYRWVCQYFRDFSWEMEIENNIDNLPYWLYGGIRKDVASAMNVSMSDTYHAAFDVVVRKLDPMHH